MAIKLFRQKGFSLLVIIMLLAIVSIFIAVIQNYKQQNMNIALSSQMDGRVAEQIALIGIEMGLHEWKTNFNASTTYTPNAAAFTGFTILGGTLDVYFNTTNSNFSSGSVTIRSIGKYNNAQRTLDVSFNLVKVKRMAVIDSTNTDTSLNTRDQSFKELGWAVTHFSESATFPDVLNDLVQYNLVYIPSSVSDTFVSNLIEANVPIAHENRTHWALMGLTQTSGQDSALTNQLYIHSTCNYCTTLELTSGSAFIASNINLLFNQFILADLSLGTKPELSLDLISNNVALGFIEPGAQRANTSSSPNVRIGLPVQTGSQSFSNLTSEFVTILDQYLTLGACNFNTTCQKRVEVVNWNIINNTT